MLGRYMDDMRSILDPGSSQDRCRVDLGSIYGRSGVDPGVIQRRSMYVLVMLQLLMTDLISNVEFLFDLFLGCGVECAHQTARFRKKNRKQICASRNRTSPALVQSQLGTKIEPKTIDIEPTLSPEAAILSQHSAKVQSRRPNIGSKSNVIREWA